MKGLKSIVVNDMLFLIIILKISHSEDVACFKFACSYFFPIRILGWALIFILNVIFSCFIFLELF